MVLGFHVTFFRHHEWSKGPEIDFVSVLPARYRLTANCVHVGCIYIATTMIFVFSNHRCQGSVLAGKGAWP